MTQNATFNLFFLGLGWHWVGEFVGFILIFSWYMFSNPTEFGKQIAKHPTTDSLAPKATAVRFPVLRGMER